MVQPSDFLDLLNDSVLVRDLAGRIQSWNEASTVLYGYGPEDALGQNAHDLLNTTHAESNATLDACVLAAGVWAGEISRRSATGAELRIESCWSLQRSGAGMPIGIVEVGRDLTRIRSIEAALQRSELRYRYLFDQIPMALWQLDISGLTAMFADFRSAGVTDIRSYLDAHPETVRRAMDLLIVEDVNERIISMFGARNADDLRGPVSRFWRHSPETFKRAMIARFEGALVFQEETKLRTLDDRFIDVLFTTTRPEPEARPNRSLVGFVDITERVRAQEDLNRIRTDFAHTARVSMLGEFTASIAHELNQPLAAISTHAAAGQRWLNRPVPDLSEVKMALEWIRVDAGRAAGIVSSIREMASRRPLKRASVVLNEVVREALAFLHHEFRAGAVQVMLRLDDKLPSVDGDRILLQQVIVNLILNATQALVTMRPDRRGIEISTVLEGTSSVRLVVADTGPGIDEDVLPSLFQAFFTTKTNGMGLGLPICRTIIEAHGGTIDATNAAGGGARFSFTIPVCLSDGSAIG